MNEYWFKPKDRGYGNVPTAWQGWALTLGFSAFVVAVAIAVKLEALSVIWCVVTVLVVTAGFLALAKAKTDGDWRWR